MAKTADIAGQNQFYLLVQDLRVARTRKLARCKPMETYDLFKSLIYWWASIMNNYMVNMRSWYSGNFLPLLKQLKPSTLYRNPSVLDIVIQKQLFESFLAIRTFQYGLSKQQLSLESCRMLRDYDPILRGIEHSCANIPVHSTTTYALFLQSALNPQVTAQPQS